MLQPLRVFADSLIGQLRHAAIKPTKHNAALKLYSALLQKQNAEIHLPVASAATQTVCMHDEGNSLNSHCGYSCGGKGTDQLYVGSMKQT